MSSAKKEKPALTHLNAQGEMQMVDVGQKPSTHRIAVAHAKVLLGPAAKKAAKEGGDKGDVLAAARFAGITAAKKTADLIPLCHPLGLTHVSVDIRRKRYGLLVEARAETFGPTGVEMEAMTAASVAALTIYDMLKALDRGMTIEQVRLLKKSGGKSGLWKRRGVKL